MKSLFLFTSWGRGAYLDRWSFLHLLWGGVYAVVFRTLGFTITQGWWATLIVATAWEIYERLFGKIETIPNSILDVVLAVAGFALLHRFVPEGRVAVDAALALCLLLAISLLKFLSTR